MVSVIFAVLEVSFRALTTVVKLPWKFLTLIFAVLLPFFLLRDATQARPQSSCGVCPSVYPCVCHVRICILSKRINISSNFFTFGHSNFSVPNVIANVKAIFWRTPPLTGASNARGVGRNRDSDPISGFIACCERCYGQLLSTRLSADACSSGINWRWSVQWCITDCHGASLFMAQKATHQWIRRREKKRTLFNLRSGKSNARV